MLLYYCKLSMKYFDLRHVFLKSIKHIYAKNHA